MQSEEEKELFDSSAAVVDLVFAEPANELDLLPPEPPPPNELDAQPGLVVVVGRDAGLLATKLPPRAPRIGGLLFMAPPSRE